jgi:hypothetical protein
MRKSDLHTYTVTATVKHVDGRFEIDLPQVTAANLQEDGFAEGDEVEIKFTVGYEITRRVPQEAA